MKHVMQALARASSFAPTNGEGIRAANSDPLKANKNEPHDSANCALPAQAADHPDNAGNQCSDKEFATARAQLAIRGFVLQRIDDGDGRTVFLVSRWNMSRSLSDLSAVHDFAERAGVPHG